MNVKLRNLLVFMSKVAIYTYLAFFAFLTYANESEAQRKKLGEVKINLSTSSHTWALDELMDEIESKSVFQFAYRRGDVKRKQIYLDPSEWNLFDLLKEISSQGRFDIKRVNESIALTPVNTNTALPSISERIQTFEVSISGRVIDENGEPLIGVAILEKGTTNGTTTDISGNFQLDLISEDPSIIISYVGYAQQEINVGNQTTFDIQLELDIESLAEIVVVGYGSVKKSDLTGAVSSVKSEDLVERPVPTIDQALQGRVAGATIRTNSAAPGGGMNIVIRGVGSINSSTQPLYILNGIPVGDVDNIPAEDVESVEILKDASATAIYGARGANGVVLVTTKTGKAGKPILSYNNRFSFETADTDLNLMNGPEFAQFYTEWELANGVDPANVFYNGSSELNPLPENAGNTNWFDEISRTGLQQNHNLSLSGGSERSTYAVSLNYLDHRGILEGSDYSRLSLNLNNTYEVKDWINVGLNIVVSSDDRNSVGENATLEGDGFSAINAALKMMPTLPIFDENGDFVENLLPGSQSRENPVAAATQYLNQRRQTRGVGKLFLEFTPFDGFKFKTSIGANLVNTKFNTYQPRTTILGGLIDGEATNSQNISSYFINEYIATYDKTFARHNIGVLAGFTLEGQTTEGFSNEANGFFTDAYENNNIGAGTNILGNSFKNKWTIASFISRVNYSYDNKYLLTLTGRYDGSSRFAEDNQWGFFPSAAVAWKLSEEPFFPQSNIVTFVKLRASYGSAGNSNIGLYNSLATFNLANYTLGTALAPGVRVGRLSNPNFGWESLVSSNVGLDIGLINDRVDLTVDVYKKTTQDLIASASLIETSGLSNANINVGELENRGLELGVEARVISDGDFKWFVSGNISFNSNEVTKWNGDPANDWRIGNPIGVRRAIEIDGIIRTPEELEAYPIDGAQLGEFRQVDQNGDSLLNGDDQVIVFDPTPQFTYGFSHDFSYKAFSLSFAFYGFYGGQIYNESNRRALQTQVIRNNMSRDLIDNYWTPENPNAEFPALDASTTSNNVAIEDGSFLRLQNILLAYKFPKVKGVKSLSVFASAQNVFTWTKYTGFDPDANSTASGGPSNIGEDRTSFPIPRSYTVGVQVSF